MSAPDTNIEKQTRRHKPALFGIFAAIAVGGLLFLTIFFSAVDDDAAATNDAVNVNSAASD
jgi:hypothetical protein